MKRAIEEEKVANSDVEHKWQKIEVIQAEKAIDSEAESSGEHKESDAVEKNDVVEKIHELEGNEKESASKSSRVVN